MSHITFGDVMLNMDQVVMVIKDKTKYRVKFTHNQDLDFGHFH